MRDQKKTRSKAGPIPEAGSVSATDAQNNFGQVLARAASQGAVFIRKYGHPAAVVLSVERYRELVGGGGSELDELTEEFDELLARMQTEEAAAATDALFGMESEELGEAAVRGAEHEDD